MKKITDKQRGILAGRWLAQKPTHQTVFSMKEWKKLKLFLRATGEFKEELIRISWVENYLKTLNTTRQLKRFTSFIAFATYFQETSHKHLSTFTCNVIDFQQQHQKKYFGKEDYFLCGRAEAEYHLNMVGAAFMNKSLKEEYEQTQKKFCFCLRAWQHQRIVKLNSMAGILAVSTATRTAIFPEPQKRCKNKA